jgi:hypothetical protein
MLPTILTVMELVAEEAAIKSETGVLVEMVVMAR